MKNIAFLPERMRLNGKTPVGTNRSWYFGIKSILASINSSNFKRPFFPKRFVSKSTEKIDVPRLNGGISLYQKTLCFYSVLRIRYSVSQCWIPDWIRNDEVIGVVYSKQVFIFELQLCFSPSLAFAGKRPLSLKS